MIKILHVLPDFAVGGAEKVVVGYLTFYKNNPDFDVRALSLGNNKNRIYEQFVINNELALDYLNQNTQDNSIASRIHQIKEIHDYIDNYNPDIIHIHLSILWMVCFATLGTNVKAIIHTLHSDPSKTSVGKNKYIDLFCYHAFRVTPICLTIEFRDLANRMFHLKRAKVLPNGINFSDYNSGERHSIRQNLSIPASAFVIGHVGRFHAVKNHKKLVKVFYEVFKQNDNAHLIMIGEGEEKSKIKKLVDNLGIKNNVTFIDPCFDVNRYYQVFDCFVFPSIYEGLGIVVIEAQAAGVPCVISNSIPKDVIFSDKVSVININATDSEWANEILSQSNVMLPQTDASKYQLDNVMINLETIYKEALK